MITLRGGYIQSLGHIKKKKVGRFLINTLQYYGMRSRRVKTYHELRKE